jgi:hypothetical protein
VVYAKASIWCEKDEAAVGYWGKSMGLFSGRKNGP